MFPPIQPHPQNPHYFLFRGQPTILITSAEHYGALINLDFDIPAYLDVLAARGMNCTRIYPGAYVEPEHYFIHDNTLGPRPGRMILPWARSATPGYPLGGSIFDLDRWDEAYFARLHTLLSEAGRRGIVVEICLFNAAYPDTVASMPLYHTNNLQGVGTCICAEVQALKDEQLNAYQEAYVRKITREANPHDNVILEICDEPGLHGTLPEEYRIWISFLIEAIIDEEQGLPNRHLIAQQICTTPGGPGDLSGDPRLGVIVGQYVGPTSGGQLGGVQLLDGEYQWNKPIELNETAFYPIWYSGDKMGASRVEAWEFILGGGASFNHLNGLYSTVNNTAAGTENDSVLAQLQSLQGFMAGLDYLRMARDPAPLAGGLPEGVFARGMREEGRQYALYLHHSRCENVKYIVEPGDYQERLELEIAPGRYRVEWIEPQTGKVLSETRVDHPGGRLALETPRYTVDIALRMLNRRD